ncbi:MAG TPA: fumarylacetoacetate hydrolase family protein [Sporolactobacillaceae bacterium]|nr:fumarylacetoacetate hydrolase family protein [Sporolactobacillaceae bacterium]
MENIRNIFCVGRNYADHAKELNNEVPTSPFLFSKPTHALVEANGQPIPMPKNSGAIHYETELVLHISKPYEKGMKVDDLVDKMALGIDFTLRDVQTELKKKSHPWLRAKGFKNSAVLTRFIDFPGFEACKQVDFALIKNGEEVQHGNIKDMIFDLQILIDFTGEHFGLGPGDIIYTGTPAGVGPTEDGDHFVLSWGHETLGEFSTELK